MSSGKLQKVSPQIAASLNLCHHNRTTAPGFRAPKPYKYSLQTTGDKKNSYTIWVNLATCNINAYPSAEVLYMGMLLNPDRQ